MDNNKKKNIIIVLLILLVITMGSYIINDKLLNNKSDNKNENVILNEETTTNTIDAKNEVTNRVKNEISTYNNKENYSYESYEIDNIISLVIIYKDEIIKEVIKTYNYDKQNNKYLSNKELLDYYKISETEFNNSIKKQYVNFYNEDNKKYIEHLENDKEQVNTIYDIAKQRLKETLDEINNKTYNYDDYKLFVDNDGKIKTQINNKTWMEKRPEVSWREAGSVSYKIVEINKEDK